MELGERQGSHFDIILFIGNENKLALTFYSLSMVACAVK